MKIKKLQAGALQLTIFISVVIGIILASFILLMQLHKQFEVQTSFIKETVNNAQSGIDYALINDMVLNDSTFLNIYDEEYKTLSLYKNYWGIFEKVTSKSKIKKQSFIKTALIGTSQSDNNRTALYLKDNKKPLILVGNTKIEGTAYLPEQGVKPGNISGHSYYGAQLIYGNIYKSRDLPKFSSELLNHLSHYKTINESHFIDMGTDRAFANSFTKPKKQIYSTGDILLTNITLNGHIEVVSETKIIVDTSAVLNDIVLMAPEIEIKDYVEGAFQALANKNIAVGKQCRLHYPSALVLVPKKESNDDELNSPITTKQIDIGDGSEITGTVIFYGKTKPNNFNPQLIIRKESIVKGEVYCSSNLELKGRVYGTVFTSDFVAKESGSIYQNHIYNGNIIIKELPAQYVGISFEASNKGIIKWLY
ncbi:hypothetical protein [Xanthomarina gelatinilytica]|uniref:hypothetical protein n=1 Tax=Xanthomarina gelatinilytica TaxID=1137281 RepID=UPI003AA83A61